MFTRKSFKFIIASLICILLFVSCKPWEKPSPPVELSPERKAKITQTVITWLECEECDEGELDRLKKASEYAVPTLTAALESGPSPASLELMRLQMEERYDRLVEYGRTHPNARVTQSKKDFVAHYMNNYIALYRIRAVQGLSAIGGENAHKAIENASRKSYRDDVNNVIRKVLEE
jgi:hypothetical protein